MNWRPYGKAILALVELQSAEKKVGDLVVISTATEEPYVGKVLAVGDDDVPMIAPGQRILFSRYAGKVVEIDGVKHHVLRPDDIDLVALS